MAESVDAADLKSAGRKTVGVQVSLPPSLKRLAVAGLVGGNAALRSDPPPGLRGGEKPGVWWWPLTPMAAGWAASSWRLNAMAEGRRAISSAAPEGFLALGCPVVQ